MLEALIEVSAEPVVARRIVVDAVDPAGLLELAEALSPHDELDVRRPARARPPWELRSVHPAA